MPLFLADTTVTYSIIAFQFIFLAALLGGIAGALTSIANALTKIEAHLRRMHNGTAQAPRESSGE